MSLMDDLKPFIKEVYQINQEFQDIKKKVIDSVVDQSKVTQEIKSDVDTIAESTVSEASCLIAEIKKTFRDN